MFIALGLKLYLSSFHHAKPLYDLRRLFVIWPWWPRPFWFC